LQLLTEEKKTKNHLGITCKQEILLGNF